MGPTHYVTDFLQLYWPPGRRRKCVSPKCCFSPARPHGVMARKTKTVTCMNMILYCRMFILKCPSLQAALPWRKHQQLNHISEFRGILCMTSFLKPTSGNRDYRNIGRVTAIRCVGTETNLRPHFPYCSIDPGEVQWRNSRRYAVILDVMLLSVCGFGEKQCKECLCFCFGRKWNYIFTCTVQNVRFSGSE